MDAKLNIVKTLLLAAPLFLSPPSLAFDSQPHVLVLPGHTNSLSAGPDGEVLVTCDYKTLDGRVPRPGEPCTGEPTLAISVKDLKNLRYISEGRDNNEIVQRVYERYDNIVFIVSPDFEVPNTRVEYDLEAGPVTVRPPGIPEAIYNDYSRRVEKALYLVKDHNGRPGYLRGITFSPYMYHSAFEGLPNNEPLKDMWHQLADKYLIFLPANPGHTTIIHELMHYLMGSARGLAIISQQRNIQLLKNRGLRGFLSAHVLNPDSVVQLDESVRAAYQVSQLEYLVEHVDDAAPEEVEVNYFLAKYRHALKLPDAADDHLLTFWIHANIYAEQIAALASGSEGNFFIPHYAHRYVLENRPFVYNGVTYPNFYRNIWNSAKILSQAYPKNLLGDEQNPEPGTMMYQFIRDIGARAQTGK